MTGTKGNGRGDVKNVTRRLSEEVTLNNREGHLTQNTVKGVAGKRNSK